MFHVAVVQKMLRIVYKRREITSKLFRLQTGVLTHNPVRDTIAPSPGDARDRHIEMAEILALADEQEEPYRTLAILLHATGLDQTPGGVRGGRHRGLLAARFSTYLRGAGDSGRCLD
jgi:hypothetical protein